MMGKTKRLIMYETRLKHELVLEVIGRLTLDVGRGSIDGVTYDVGRWI